MKKDTEESREAVRLSESSDPFDQRFSAAYKAEMNRMEPSAEGRHRLLHVIRHPEDAGSDFRTAGPASPARRRRALSSAAALLAVALGTTWVLYSSGHLSLGRLSGENADYSAEGPEDGGAGPREDSGAADNGGKDEGAGAPVQQPDSNNGEGVTEPAIAPAELGGRILSPDGSHAFYYGLATGETWTVRIYIDPLYAFPEGAEPGLVPPDTGDLPPEGQIPEPTVDILPLPPEDAVIDLPGEVPDSSGSGSSSSGGGADGYIPVDPGTAVDTPGAVTETSGGREPAADGGGTEPADPGIVVVDPAEPVIDPDKPVSGGGSTPGAPGLQSSITLTDKWTVEFNTGSGFQPLVTETGETFYSLSSALQLSVPDHFKQVDANTLELATPAYFELGFAASEELESALEIRIVLESRAGQVFLPLTLAETDNP